MSHPKLPSPLYEVMKSTFDSVGKVRAKFAEFEIFEPELRFTPGDRLIGDTGEALAMYLFDLKPMDTKNAKGHDFKSGRSLVQVKATSSLKKGNLVGLGLKKTKFDKLLVFKIHPEGKYEILYNGPGKLIYDKVASSSVTESKLKILYAEVKSKKSLAKQSLKPKTSPSF